MKPQDTLREIFQAFRVYRQATATPATQAHDAWCFRYFDAYLAQCDALDLRTACLQFLVWLRQQPLAQGSCATISGRFCHMLRWAVDEGYLEKLPLKPKELPKQPEPAPEPLTLEEIQSLLMVVNDHWVSVRNRAILITLLETGCRVGELVQITRGHVDAGVASVIQKGNRPHQLLLTTPCLESMYAYLDVCPYRLAPENALWRTHDNRPVDAKRVALLLRRWGDRVGIHLYPHRLRQTSATLRLAAGAPTEVVRRALGHSSERALRHYVKLADQQQRQLLEATSPIRLIAK